MTATAPSIPAAPEGYATINPFIITKDADGLIRFLIDVFGAVESPDARTVDRDGLLLHAELRIGNATIMFADRKPDWPFTPSLLQIYVDDVPATLARAAAGGARVVTEPTDFFGDVFSRFVDPWNNLWWVYTHTPAEDGGVDWSADDAGSEWADGAAAGEGEEWGSTPELDYIHDTLLATLPTIRDEG